MNLLCASAAKALSSPVEVTVRQLMSEYGMNVDISLLDSLLALKASLECFELRLDPDIGTLGLDDTRVLSARTQSSLVNALEAITKGESHRQEFKSSVFFDWRKFSIDPSKAIQEYKLEALVQTIMKSIAALSNTDGGDLYVGVSDDCAICGLEGDFELANPNRKDFDGWEQSLRAQIESRFIDGRAVNSYVRTEHLHHQGKSFVKMQIAPRSEISFLRKPGGGSCELYIRSGTRSIALPYEDIQKHYEMRRKF